MQLHPEWEFVADGVMGGVSNGTLSHEHFHDRDAAVLRGDVSLDNNGGFVQIAFDLRPDGTGMDATAWTGIKMQVYGNDEAYDIRLRTDQLQRPWQSFRTEITAKPQWHDIHLPFASFEPHKTDARFDAGTLRRVGVLAIGRVFHAEIGIADVALYR